MDPNQPFVVGMDASNYVIGAVLLQGVRPITFDSKKLDSAQHYFSTYERELYAIVYPLDKWWHYFYGAQFEIVFDHTIIVS